MKAESTRRSFPTRRDMLRIVAVGGAAAVAWRLGLLDRLRGGGPVTRSRTLMGTGVHLTVLGDDREAAQAAAEATLERMAELENVLSAYRPDSDLSRLNVSGALEQAPEALLDVLRRADGISRLGDGAFDLTVQPLLDLYRERRSRLAGLPSNDDIERRLELVGFRGLRVEGRHVRLERPGMRITVDGIGKGWIVDRGVEVLRGRGFANVFVEAGGDLVASGDKGAGTPWRIGIRGPRPGLALQARFDARNRAVATSGDYMQPFTDDYSQHHILDPRTGYSSPELASSTVVAPDAATADALATLTMVLGPVRGRELVEDLLDCEAYFVDKNLGVTRTSGFSVV
jgi:thiamine biosynthesis lipoprotein